MHHPKSWLGVLGALVPIVLGLSVMFGAVSLSLSEIVAVLSGRATDQTAVTILTQIRLPRVLLAALVGGALGLCGAVMQGLFRNPLADPYLLGIASGATAGAAVVIALHLRHLLGGSTVGGVGGRRARRCDRLSHRPDALGPARQLRAHPLGSSVSGALLGDHELSTLLQRGLS
jgi:ABC-type Fe3+-siderophore transport system permease subunit